MNHLKYSVPTFVLFLLGMNVYSQPVQYQERANIFLRIESIDRNSLWKCSSCPDPCFRNTNSCSFEQYYNVIEWWGYRHLNLVTVPYTYHLNPALNNHRYWIQYGGPDQGGWQQVCFDDDALGLRFEDFAGHDCLELPKTYTGNYFMYDPVSTLTTINESNVETFWMQIMTQCERCDLPPNMNDDHRKIVDGLWWKGERTVDYQLIERSKFLRLLDGQCSYAIEFNLYKRPAAPCDSEKQYGCGQNEVQN